MAMMDTCITAAPTMRRPYDLPAWPWPGRSLSGRETASLADWWSGCGCAQSVAFARGLYFLSVLRERRALCVQFIVACPSRHSPNASTRTRGRYDFRVRWHRNVVSRRTSQRDKSASISVLREADVYRGSLHIGFEARTASENTGLSRDCCTESAKTRSDIGLPPRYLSFGRTAARADGGRSRRPTESASGLGPATETGASTC